MFKAETGCVDVDDDNYLSEEPLVDALVPSRIDIEVKQKPKSSWVWSHFKNSTNGDKAYCFCLLCRQDIKYGQSHSTGILEHHIKVLHPKTYSNRCAEKAAQRLAAEPDVSPCINASTSTATTALSSKSPIGLFLTPWPSFESTLLSWMIKTYQPLSVTECSEFRNMCESLNKRCPILGHDKIGRMVSHEYHTIQQKLIVAFKRRHFALTTDAWMSIAKTGYVTCTAHFIDRDTWMLHSLVLGLYEKTGCSRAVDFVEYAEQQMEAFNLHYYYMTCVVTDTEATNNKLKDYYDLML
jgi:hypothetical protein